MCFASVHWAVLPSLDLSLFILCKFYAFTQRILIISTHNYTSSTLLNALHPITLPTSCYPFFLTTPPWVQLVLIVYVGPSTRARTSYRSSCPQRRGTLRANRSSLRVGPLNAASTHVEFWYIPVFPPPPGHFTAFSPSVPLLPSVAAVVTSASLWCFLL